MRRRLLLVLPALALALYAAPLAYLYAFQRAYVFRPSQERVHPAEAGLPGAQVHEVATADGERILVWYVPPPASGAPVIVSFHGQTGTVARVAERLRAFAAAGFGVLGVSYRGYGGSTGVPTEEGLHRDAQAAFAWLEARSAGARRFVHGFSLGAAVAVRLAAERAVDGLILEAPFASAVDVAAIRYPVFPVRWLMHDPFRSDLAIPNVTAPLLVLHGTEDRTVPIAQGEKLFGLAGGTKRFVAYPGAGHNDLPRHGAVDEMVRFVRDLSRAPSALAE